MAAPKERNPAYFDALRASPEQHAYLHGSWDLKTKNPEVSGYIRDLDRVSLRGNKAMEIRIQKVTNGWIVNAGCMTLVFDDAAKLGTELTRWLQDPGRVEREYTLKYQGGPAQAIGGGEVRGPEIEDRDEAKQAYRHTNDPQVGRMTEKQFNR